MSSSSGRRYRAGMSPNSSRWPSRSPGKLDYGSGGNGSAAHLATEYFKLKAGIDVQHVPYKGTAPALSDLLGGQIAFIITGLPPVLPHVKAGKLRILGVGVGAAPEAVPRHPDDRRVRRARIRGDAVVRHSGARRRRRRTSSPSSTATSSMRSRIPRSRTSSPPRAPIPSATRPRVRRLHPQRDRPVGQGDPRDGREGRVMSAE